MKRLPFLTPAQRRALLVIEWVLLLLLVAFSVFSWMQPKASRPGEQSPHSPSGRSAGQYIYNAEEQPFETFPFDPNTADSTTLLRLGLSPWQVRSIYRYRAKHGRYHTPEDFTRLPGLTNEQWERLRPCIRIAREFRYVEPKTPVRPPSVAHEERTNDSGTAASTMPRDTFPRLEKIKRGQAIDINTADTTLLKRIPGIASKRAARIVAYRKALGGFVAVEQAMEAIEMPDTVLKYMTLSPLPVTKISVNRLSVQQLMKHPYLNFYQAKAIFEHRRNKGELHSIEEMSRLEAFKPTDIDRLRPYIAFE